MGNSAFREMLTKFVMFASTSVAGTIVDLAVHWVLAHWVFASYFGQFILAPAISFELAALTNFVIAYHWVWRERISNRSARTFWMRFLIYSASSAGVFLVKIILMQILHWIFPSLAPVLCNLIAMCFSGTLNFFMNEWVLFRKE